ncbi:hypothetical protein NBRC116594_09670 [Shimia sp. NS0008-38b]
MTNPPTAALETQIRCNKVIRGARGPSFESVNISDILLACVEQFVGACHDRCAIKAFVIELANPSVMNW